MEVCLAPELGVWLSLGPRCMSLCNCVCACSTECVHNASLGRQQEYEPVNKLGGTGMEWDSGVCWCGCGKSIPQACLCLRMQKASPALPSTEPPKLSSPPPTGSCSPHLSTPTLLLRHSSSDDYFSSQGPSGSAQPREARPLWLPPFRPGPTSCPRVLEPEGLHIFSQIQGSL